MPSGIPRPVNSSTGSLPRHAHPALFRLADPGRAPPPPGGHGLPRGRCASARDPELREPGGRRRARRFKPADVPVALITHLHYDHWAGHSLFPNAEFWIQQDEVAFWTGPFGREPAFRSSANADALSARDAQLRRPRAHHQRRPSGLSGHPCTASADTPPGFRSSESRPPGARWSSPPTRRTSTATWRRASRCRSSRACPKCSPPSRRSTVGWAATAHRGGPRSRGGGPLQGRGAGDHQDRLTSTIDSLGGMWSL